jgi:nitrile hydratase
MNRALIARGFYNLDEFRDEVTVWDASAESRYMVLPRRPAGTGDLDVELLSSLVTRNGLIGVAPL